MKALETTPELVGGKTDFISQGDPVTMWEGIDDVLATHGLPPARRALPTRGNHALASVMGVIAKTLPLIGILIKPLLTRLLVSLRYQLIITSTSFGRREISDI